MLAVALVCLALAGNAFADNHTGHGSVEPRPAKAEPQQHAEAPLRQTLPSTGEIIRWHEEKPGAALTGSPAWQRFMAFMASELAAAGVVDIERHAWGFQRWETSQWPDRSGWSLTVAGDSVPVASYGANSGSTPADGLTAPLVVFDEENPEAVRGKIAVLRLVAPPEQTAALAGLDQEYRAPDGPWPWPGAGDEPSAPATDRLAPSAEAIDSVSWQIFPQLMQLPGAIQRARAAGAAGALIVLDANRGLAEGLYSFPVPDHHAMPTLFLDRETGAQVLAAAREGAEATLTLRAEMLPSEAYQLVAYLPGRHYGTPRDEVIQLVTHTDGPSVSQDNGALGLLGLVRHFGTMAREERPRTLMVFLDCRHYMPGQEPAFREHDATRRGTASGAPIVAVIGMEHLGQVEYVEQGDGLAPSGRVDPSMIWTTDDERLVNLAIDAVQASGLPGATVRNVARPGKAGGSQGRWYGMASPERAGGLPAVAIMGTMGAYWSLDSRLDSGLDRLDPVLFQRQLETFVRITEELMEIEFRTGSTEPLAP